MVKKNRDCYFISTDKPMLCACIILILYSLLITLYEKKERNI